MPSIALVFLPPWSTFYPYSSLPLLKGYLRTTGVEATIFDFNATFFDDLLSRRRWRTLHGQLEKRAGEFAAAGRPDLQLEARKCLQLSDEIDAGLGLCRRIFRDRQLFFDPFRLRTAVNIYEWVFKALNLVVHPHRLLFSDLNFGYVELLSSESTEGLVSVSDFFDPYLDEWANEILGAETDAVGFSIINRGQFSLSTRLAHLLRKKGFAGDIQLGGPFVDDHHGLLAEDRHLTSLVDLRAHDADERRAILDVFAIDPGTYRSDCYLAPEPVVGLAASFGCNWNHCAFCSYSQNQTEYLEASPDRVADTVARLRREEDFRFYHFDESSITPTFLREFADGVLRRGADIRWRAMIRIENDLSEDDIRLFAKSGCRWLSFGMESVSRRLLHKMNKGIDPDRFHRFLGWCGAQGVSTDAFFLKGFPGERASEQRQTLDFIRAHEQYLDIFCFTQYFPACGSEMDRHPDRFDYHIERNTTFRTPYERIFSPYVRVGEVGMAPEEASTKALDFADFAHEFEVDRDFMTFESDTFMKGVGISINYLFRVLYAFEGVGEPSLPEELILNPSIAHLEVPAQNGADSLRIHYPRGTCNTLEGESQLIQLLEHLEQPKNLSKAFECFRELYTWQEFLLNAKRLYLNGYLHAH